MSTFRFQMPSLSLMGAGSLKEAGVEMKNHNFKKALIVTDKELVKLGLIQNLIDTLDDNDIDYVVFDGTHPNPTTKNVEEGLSVLENENCDFVISFGGGSPHDCAKAIALVATNGGSIRDFEGLNKSKRPQLPLVAINTTAGTASEMTLFAIITDEERKVKMAIVDRNTTPLFAVDDPELMVQMPKGLTAATGMDALTHAIEALVSTAATPITDGCALTAIELISNNLRKAVSDGANIQARDQMAYAEFLAGMAFNNASLGYVHAMAHQLGGYYDLPHGVCNAVLLPHVEAFNLDVSAPKLKRAAKAMGLNVDDVSSKEAAQMAIQEIKKLSQDIGIPSGLAELGAKESDLDILAENALKDACGLTNPKQANKDEIVQIFRRAM